MDSIPDIQKYLLLNDSDHRNAEGVIHETVRKLESKQISLIDVVQSLGEYITNEDSTIRSKTIQYLSQIIGEVPQSILSRQQVQVLCQFMCDRIEDGGAIEGLCNLQGFGKFDKTMAVMTFRAMIENFQDLQTRSQAERFRILKLLNALLLNNRLALKEMGDESLIAITDLVSGEKDPRNLMIVFSVLRVIMIEWDISSHPEVLFDSVFRYFPITFRPPPNDPYGITAQDLKSRLRDCIATSGYLAPFVFPQLIEKLDSISLNVKKDVLQVITLCVLRYDSKSICTYSSTLWESLKYEILNVQEEDLAEEALVALQAIASKLSLELAPSNPTSALARYLRPITKECNEHLREPLHKLAKPAGLILSSLCQTSPVALFLIVKAVLPSLLTLYQDMESIAQKKALLEVFVQLFDAAITVCDSKNTTSMDSEIPNPLDMFKDRLFDIASQALMSTFAEEVSFRVVAANLLSRFCSLRHYLLQNEIGMIIQYLNDIILFDNQNGPDDLKKEAIQALVEISRSKPNLVMDISFPVFMARLPDLESTKNNDYLVTLEGLARLSVERTIAETLIRRLANKLDLVLQKDQASSSYPRAILSTLYYILSSQQNLAEDQNLGFYYEKILVALINQVVLASTGICPPTALNEDTSMETLGRLGNLIVRATTPDQKRSVGLQVYSLFTEASLFPPIPSRESLPPKKQRMTMILSTWMMAGIPSGSSLVLGNADAQSLQFLLERLVSLALVEDVPIIRQSILRQIALITNKHLAPDQIQYAIDILWDLTKGLANANLTENSVRIAFWIAKGLVSRLVKTEEVLERLLGLLQNSSFGLISGRGFGILLAPDEIFSTENGVTIRLLAKQKIFNFCIPKIANDFRQAESSAKANFLHALSGILQYMPTDILMTEIDSLLPLLLQSLDLEDADVKAATVESLIVIGQDSPKAIEGHTSSLVNRLLKCSVIGPSNSARVRVNALRCLRIFPGKIKDRILLPLRSEVIGSLMAALDDSKRHVRKEAVECSAAWFHMDEPNDD